MQVAGFRIDNDEIVGEFFTGSGQTQAEFARDFSERYGTDARAVGLLIEESQSTS